LAEPSPFTLNWLRRARSYWPYPASGSSSPPAVLNVVSSGVRAATRAVWSLFVPYLLSIDAYGFYAVFQTTGLAVAQASILGTPQIILREPNRELPMAGFFLHSVGIAALVLLIMGFTVAHHDWMFYTLVALSCISVILYMQLTMRAKSHFQFGRVLRSESTGTAVFGTAILLIALMASFFGKSWLDYRIMGAVEILATGAIVAALLLGPGGRLTHRERGVREVREYLPSVYSVGVVVLFDVVIFRRLEVYFLQESPAGLQGVAVFGLSAQIFNMVLLVPSAMIEAWGPTFARSFRSGPSEFAQTVQQKLGKYRKLYVLIILGTLVLTPLLTATLFRKYQAWTWYITAFVLTRVVCSYAGFHSATLYSSRRERLLYGPAFAGAAISIASNVLLTLRWGVPGAVVAYALTQFTVAASTMAVAWWSRRPPAPMSPETVP